MIITAIEIYFSHVPNFNPCLDSWEQTLLLCFLPLCRLLSCLLSRRFCANSSFILRACSSSHHCLQRPLTMGLTCYRWKVLRDQLLSLEFSEIDLILLNLTIGRGRPVSAQLRVYYQNILPSFKNFACWIESFWMKFVCLFSVQLQSINIHT